MDTTEVLWVIFYIVIFSAPFWGMPGIVYERTLRLEKGWFSSPATSHARAMEHAIYILRSTIPAYLISAWLVGYAAYFMGLGDKKWIVYAVPFFTFSISGLIARVQFGLPSIYAGFGDSKNASETVFNKVIGDDGLGPMVIGGTRMLGDGKAGHVERSSRPLLIEAFASTRDSRDYVKIPEGYGFGLPVILQRGPYRSMALLGIRLLAYGNLVLLLAAFVLGQSGVLLYFVLFGAVFGVAPLLQLLLTAPVPDTTILGLVSVSAALAMWAMIPSSREQKKEWPIGRRIAFTMAIWSYVTASVFCLPLIERLLHNITGVRVALDLAALLEGFGLSWLAVWAADTVTGGVVSMAEPYWEALTRISLSYYVGFCLAIWLPVAVRLTLHTWLSQEANAIFDRKIRVPFGLRR